jgi:hypothetical protein
MKFYLWARLAYALAVLLALTISILEAYGNAIRF